MRSAARTSQLGRRSNNVIKLRLSLPSGLFVVESANPLSMVNRAGCHRFVVLSLKSIQQNDNQHLFKPLKLYTWGLIAAPKPPLGQQCRKAHYHQSKTGFREEAKI